MAETAGVSQAELDDEGKRLALEAAKAEYRKQIAAAQASTLAVAMPSSEGAPTGKTTLGEHAGTFGPWLAHQALDDAAAAVAASVAEELTDSSGVLVVERRDLLSGESTYQQVQVTLAALRDRLTLLTVSLGAERIKLRPAPTPPQHVLDRLAAVAEGRERVGTPQGSMRSGHRPRA